MRTLLHALTIAMLAGATVLSCGKSLPQSRLIFPPECELVEVRTPSDTVTVALLDGVEPNYAPWAHNAGEQILFGHLYETLAMVDCLGNILPLLAGVWRSDNDGRRWTFELRDGARFWDGSKVTAQDVALSWQDAMSQNAPIDSVTVSGDDVLHVYFGFPHREFPRILCGPAFAVAKPVAGSRWLVGSGPYRVISTRSNVDRKTFVAEPVSGKGTVLQFVENVGSDARDFLKRNVDIMITSDPAVIEYAEGKPELTLIALEWDRTYVLLSASRIRELRRGGTVGRISVEFSERLARDAVRGDARGCRSDAWWGKLEMCGRTSRSGFPPVPKGAYESSNRHILYDEHDPIARDLAERIVALAGTDPTVSADAALLASAVPGLTDGVRVTAEGVSVRTMTSSLRVGLEFGYIVSVPIRPYDACDEATILRDRVPWIVTLKTGLRGALIPLVETRPHVIVVRDRARVTVDWYGNILLGNRAAGWRAR